MPFSINLWKMLHDLRVCCSDQRPYHYNLTCFQIFDRYSH